MSNQGIDVLITTSTNGQLGGYGRYLTDVPAYGGLPITVVLPVDDPVTVVAHGPFDGELGPDDAAALGWRGVERVLTYPYFPSVDRTERAQAEILLGVLATTRPRRVGLLGAFHMPAATKTYLRQGLHGVLWSDASSLVDEIRAIKSDEEQELIRATAAAQDQAMEAAFAAARPGVREREVVAVAEATMRSLGGEQGVYLSSSAPAGETAPIGPPHMQARILREGDTLNLLIEGNGPGGLYAELGRSCVLGEVHARAQEELELALDVRRFYLERLVPGADPARLWQETNAYLESLGRPPERRLACHAQGYDLVERPLVRGDESMPIAAGMNFACHPMWEQDGHAAWICDNYLIEEGGPSERLHAFPEQIIEVG